METDVFTYGKDERPNPKNLKQGFICQWDGKKRQLWMWGFPNIKPDDIKIIVKAVLNDIEKS